jgi:proliferating cell nuclear antigen
MYMKLTLAEPKYLKDSIASISELVTEGRFNITNDGITLTAMDPANVAMVVFKLLSSSFVEYELDKETTIGINLTNLKHILKRVSSNDPVTLSATDDKLIVTIAGKATRKFSLPLLDLEEREQRVPNLQFNLKIEMPTDNFAAAIEDMSIVSDSLSLYCDGEAFKISASGDLTDADVDMHADKELSIEATGTEKFKSRYSIEYLKKMMTAGKIADNVVIQFAKDYPLKLEFLEKDRVQLSFVLAPRVEND